MIDYHDCTIKSCSYYKTQLTVDSDTVYTSSLRHHTLSKYFTFYVCTLFYLYYGFETEDMAFVHNGCQNEQNFNLLMASLKE